MNQQKTPMFKLGNLFLNPRPAKPSRGVEADEKTSSGHNQETTNSTRAMTMLFTLIFVIVSIGLIVYLNFNFLRFWFLGDFNQNLSSIEISYIQMAKFWVEGGGGWQPLWYLGYPWHVFYTPVLPTLEVVLHQIVNFSFPHAYRVITGVAYILVPISTFFFVWQVSKSKTGALVASLIYTVAPSIISLMFPEVGADTLSEHLEPRRFTILVRWGEGPHTLSLVFLPLFGLFFHRFLEKKNLANLLAASVFFGLGALTNAIFLWVAGIMIFAFFLAEITSKEVEVVGLTKSIVRFLVISYGLVAFWYNLPFITTFFREGGGAVANWQALVPWGLIVIVLVGLGIHFAVRKGTRGKLRGLSFAFFFFLMLFAIVFTYYFSGESRLEFAPQALRLNAEVDLALSILAGVIVSSIFLFLKSHLGRFRLVGVFLACIVFLVPTALLVVFGVRQTADLQVHTKPLPAGAIENKSEYKSAIVLKEAVQGSDERVFAPGNYSFWLNYFADVPQLRGALFQSSTNHWPDHAYFQIANGVDANITLDWLKIANIGKFIYTTGASGEPYKDFKVPIDKFDRILMRRLEADGDVYFDVPLKNNSLAKVVDMARLSKLQKPFNAIDTASIHDYVLWMEQRSDNKLTVTHKSRSNMIIEGDIAKGEGILVQQTYDPGWRVKGNKGSIKKDALGFMVIEPKNSGKISVELAYSKPISVFFGYLITLTTLVFLGRGMYKSRRVSV